MSFVDELKISARAGRGGSGVVRWLHLKGKEYSGPAGGNGGDGGDVYVRAVRDLNLLARYRGEKNFAAEDGEQGGNQNKDGKRGHDFIIDLPMGSLIKNETTGEQYELLQEGECIMVLKGGRGGAGNAAFKSSVNRSPKESTTGVAGEHADFFIELRIIADAGLVGLPNAGKTSLLNTLTGARGVVAPYAFTTLDPNLGALYGFILADIPGLIEGASAGKGLGYKFLRHISRTRLIVHCISLESETPLEDYYIVRKELSQFGAGELAKKPEIIVLTKSDIREQQEIERISAMFSKILSEVQTVSILDDVSIKRLREAILTKLR